MSDRIATEGEVYSNPHGPEETIIDHVTDTARLLGHIPAQQARARLGPHLAPRRDCEGRVTQRKHGRIWFDGWSVPDPACNQHEGGRWMSRYSDHRNYSAAEQADAYAYLLVHCPTTELAIAKLREIRRAIRELPIEETPTNA